MTRPIVGITVHTRAHRGEAIAFELGAASARAIHDAGGLPVILPAIGDAVDPMLDRLDGVVLTGGGRLPPGLTDAAPTLERVNPPRYAFERTLILAAASRGLPILGICRGMQMLNETLGGRLLPSIAADVPGALAHYQHQPGWRPTHAIAVETGSRLEEIVGGARSSVNSLHRQAVAAPGEGLRITARADDGIAEAVEATGRPFVLGVQFHPEKLLPREGRWLRLFEAFVAAARAGG